MQIIYKYQVNSSIELPIGAQILCVQIQGSPVIWALVEPDQPKEKRSFELGLTGIELRDLIGQEHRKYIGTYQMPEIKQVISIMKETQILSEQDIPGSELVTVTMMLSDPSDLYSIGLLVGIDRARNATGKILKNL